MRVFIACPIGASDSAERIRSDKLLKHIINPALKSVCDEDERLEIIRSDQIAEPGKITNQIIREIVNADCVLADLTDTNANVMYEVGVRQAIAKPLVLLAEKGQKLPFDLSDYRTIFYQLELDFVESAQSELSGHITKSLEGELSAMDKALFGRIDSNSANDSGGNDLISVLDVCSEIKKETVEAKQYLIELANIILEMRNSRAQELQFEKDKRNQELGMQLFGEMLKNPESMDKFVPMMERMANLGKKPNGIEDTKKK
ncbi:hypothetical protein [Cerasicoccus frondis]|uniref:hypothetical protein n=1 Tax=Cerasicoccus frondis TaxID=490090 RepID=UPI002852ABC7|nr:hypothetical protein [Cerasicoccus frondis]